MAKKTEVCVILNTCSDVPRVTFHTTGSFQSRPTFQMKTIIFNQMNKLCISQNSAVIFSDGKFIVTVTDSFILR